MYISAQHYSIYEEIVPKAIQSFYETLQPSSGRKHCETKLPENCYIL